MKLIYAAALASVFLAGPTWAAPAPAPVNIAQMTLGYTYYNRPGADLASHDAEAAACLAEVVNITSLGDLISRPGGAVSSFGANVVDGLLSSGARRGANGAAVENCMVVRGWRVVRLPEDEGQVLAKLPQGELAARLKAWIGDDEPHGEVVRVWGNDAAKGTTTRSIPKPKFTRDGQLSLRAISPLSLLDVKPKPGLPGEGKSFRSWGKMSSPPPDAALVVAYVAGMNFENGFGLRFIHDNGEDNLLLVGGGSTFKKKPDEWFVQSIPPGRWRLSHIGAVPSVGFCFGAPSFEVKPGEVVYLGAFDMVANLGPDLSLDAPKAHLAGQPAAKTIRAAAYVNGSTAPCEGSIAYALEFEGAPFEPGYAWGGAARATSVVASEAQPAAAEGGRP